MNWKFKISADFVLVCFGRQDNVFVFPCLFMFEAFVESITYM